MSGEGDRRLALLDEIVRLEAALEDNPSFVAWRALERRIALGRGPQAKSVGALIGGYAMDLAEDPRYAQLLAARDALMEAARLPVSPPTASITETARAGSAVVAEQPVPLRPVETPPPPPVETIDAEWQPAHTSPSRAHPGALMARISSLESEVEDIEIDLDPGEVVSPPDSGEAEVVIVADSGSDADDRRTGDRSLTAQLKQLADGPVRPRVPARWTAPEAGEAEIEIVADDEMPPRRA